MIYFETEEISGRSIFQHMDKNCHHILVFRNFHKLMKNPEKSDFRDNPDTIVLRAGHDQYVIVRNPLH